MSKVNKSKTVYKCTACDRHHVRWSGKCSACGEWNSLEETQVSGGNKTLGQAKPRRSSKALPISQHVTDNGGEVRVSSGIGELDRVLGGGFVTGSLSLIGGDPGVGKSTLLLMALSRLAGKGLRTLYVTGEESARQVRLRADRLGVGGDELYLLAETDMEAVREAVDDVKPRFLVLDSVQVMRSPTSESIPGSISQIRAVADQAMMISKGQDISTVLIGHVTRAGNLAGPKLLEHLVDTVIYFECDGRSPLRILRAVKNRFGATGELGLFEMVDDGLLEVPDASARLLSERVVEAPGTAVVAALEGSRPLLTEVQALVGRPTQGNPARTTLGVERARVAMLLAVLDKMDVPVADRDVYVSAAGGVRLNEPAADLGAVAAIASSLTNTAVPPDMAFFGEVGLVGEVRAVSYPAMRLNEIRRHGFRRAVIPASNTSEAPEGLEVVGVRRLQDVLSLLS